MLNPVMTRRQWLSGVAATAMAAAVWRPSFALADEFAALDATAQAALVRKGYVTALELTDAAITRIEKLEPKVNAIVSKGFDEARARAAGPLSGPFAGVPYLIKDLIEYPGLPHHAGSRMFPDTPATFRSDYVVRTDDAGLVVLGMSATPEFGFIPATEPMLDAPTRNPWNLAMSPGGSSGGAAAAVASGMVPFAHASDGGGSIRIPASACGLFGLKPSRGRNPASRRAPRVPDLSTEHCVSRSVRDSARLLDATERKGGDAVLPPTGFIAGPQTKRLRIGWCLKDMRGTEPDADVVRAVGKTAELCVGLGHEVVETQLPFDGMEFMTHFKTVWAAGAAGVVAMYEKQVGRAPDASVLEPFTLSFAQFFAKLPPDALPVALSYLQGIESIAARYFETVDIILSPVLARPNVPIGYLAPTVPFEELWDRMEAFATYTPWQNVAGVPAMSVPLFESDTGMPVGSQFTTGLGGEGKLLALAYELERAQPWDTRRPAVFAPLSEGR